ncbi:hypothetical protein Psal111_00240 [Piscirickettsia salmonis]|uniref:hypothetical protein n=1 Tax=Piscirickettsia salmonis TaxID=1238 RepID=UPI0012B6ADF6|nr:hypothetical protein [Piscirickettsia salmonis]QGO93191.1 hypothetical protein Psal111_00240 [Piscirickettsia salmonis]
MKKFIYSTITIIAIASTVYAIADYQAQKMVKKELDQWIQSQTEESNNSQISAINYGKIDTNGFFFFTHHASIHDIHDIHVQFKNFTTKTQALSLQFPELTIGTLAFTATEHALAQIKFSNITLSSKDSKITGYLKQLEYSLNGQPVGFASYNYDRNSQTETLNIDIKAGSQSQPIFTLSERGQQVPTAYTLPKNWARSFKHNHTNLTQTFKQIQQEIVNNTGLYNIDFHLDIPKLNLPITVQNYLKQLGYHKTQPLTLEITGKSTNAQPSKITTTQVHGFAKLPKAATTHFSYSLTTHSEKIAKEINKLLDQSPQNTGTETKQQQALATHLLAIEGRNIFLNNLELRYQDHSLLSRIYQENATHMKTATGLPATTQDVATLYAALIQSAQLNPAFTPYQTALAQFFQDPQELKLAIEPEKPLSLFQIFFFATHKQEAELIHALNAKLTHHA